MSTKIDMIRKAITIALIVSVIGHLIMALSAGEKVEFINGQDLTTYNSLPSNERAEWTQENTITITGLDYLKKILSHPVTSIPLLQSIVSAFFILFFSCLIMGRWVRVKNDS